MTKAEADDRVLQLTAEHPDRATHRWFARQVGDEWDVVRIPRPPGSPTEPLRPTIEAKPKPPQPDDPRTASERNAPGAWG
jgi:hypothetical protein